MTTSLSPEEERARKRQAIGLHARRPTAREEILRPPEEEEGTTLTWVSVLALVIIALVTVWMLYDMIAPARNVSVDAQGRRLILDDNFTRPTLAMGAEGIDGQWDSRFTNGTYRVQVEQPGNLAWSSLGLLDVGTYRLETALTIETGVTDSDDAPPLGYGAILVRYGNERNFYLFSVDAQGLYQIQLQKQGIWQIVQPWTRASALHSDGRSNRLGVEDDGSRLHFFANDQLLYTVSDPRLPAGDIGLGGGARSQGTVSAQYDWVKIYALPVAAPGTSAP